MAKWIKLRLSKAGISLGLCFVFLWSVLILDANGSSRIANSTLNLPANLPTSGYALTNAFADLTFDQPVAAVSPPGETNRLFVLERKGRIMVITNLSAPTKTLFLDLTTNLQGVWLESGLLGMAFHPGHATNGYFFVYRTLYTSSSLAAHGPHDQLSRFEISPDDPNRALPKSELPLIVQLDDAHSHNGGDVQFGPDGYLYLSLGDEGPSPAELTITRQPIDKSFFGAILRIDVDKRPENLTPNPHPASTTNYAIPADNPFIGATNYQGISVNPNEVRTEFFALGFRNPWRMSFDPVTGLLYCGEVGAGNTEEVNIISSGGNYGWPYREGLELTTFSTDAPAHFNSIEPVLTFGHGNATNQGRAIIGGIVYRGDRIPQLHGKYLFADNVFGHVWTTSYDGTNQPASFDWLASDPGISAFGRDPGNGDVLVVNYQHGRIQRLVYVPIEEAAPFPQTLADTGAFADLISLTPNPGILPYNINVPFWSDNAIKSRWFSVPDANAKIGFDPIGNWRFPNGTVWIKHFELELTNGVPQSRRRVETRFLVKNEDGAYGVTYRWDDSQTNAALVAVAGMDEAFAINGSESVRSQTWRYPSRAECMFCHSSAGGHALGFNTSQLNCDDGKGITNQIKWLSDRNYFEDAVSNLNELPALAHATNSHYSVGFRARSYLAANCTHCHQPGGSFTLAAQWDGRTTTHLNDTRLLPFLIKPNSPDESGLLTRISNSDGHRMPPVGSTILDTNGIALVREWVLSFPTAPWKNQDIGNVGREGDSAIFGNTYQISASGAGIGGNLDQFHFLYQPLRGNGQIIARVVSQQSSLPSAQAGIMFRESILTNAKNTTLLVKSGTEVAFQHRTENGGQTITSANNVGSSAPQWLRLVREGDTFTAYNSTNGTEWNEFASENIGLTNEMVVGLVASANNNTALNLACFDQVSLMRVGVRIEAGDFAAPAEIPITAEITTMGSPVARVEFLVGNEKIGELIQQPFTLTWTNAPSGTHTIRVRAIDDSGAAVWSEVTTVLVGFPDPSAKLLTTDRSSSGNWQGNFGADGYVIAAHATNLPSYIDISSTNEGRIWQENSIENRALRRVDSNGRIASAWEAPESFVMNLELRLGQFRRVSLYFVDWDSDNQRSQNVDVLDADDSILYARNITNFSDGKYLVLLLRGDVKLRITATGHGSAVLSGIFFDTEVNDPPEVSIANPLEGTSQNLPGDVVIAAKASDPDSSISKVEFFANGTKLGELTNAPYHFVWTNALAGTHALTARAVDEFNAVALSEPVTITTTLPLANAIFLRSDEITQGNWRGNYGLDGFILATHVTNFPSFFNLGSQLPINFTWANSTEDARALQQIEGEDRFAATWVETESFTLEFQLRDGKNHRVALYFLDWEQSGRNLAATISEAATGRTLDTQQITNISGGKYYVWNLRGHVKVQIKRASGANVVLSGIFIDPDTNTPPTIRLTHPLPGTELTVPHPLLLSVEASDDNAVAKVEFFANSQKIGESMQPPFNFLWQAVAGEYSLLAKAIDNNGAATDSVPVQISAQPTHSAAQFLGEDPVTLGDWKGSYGTLGYNVISESENYPNFAAASVSGHQSFVWIQSTIDVRAPRNALSPGRSAGGWVSETNFIIDLSLGDGIPRKVSFYCLDWDRGGRAQTFTIRDANTDALLDARTLNEFQDGKYISWSLRGDVKVEVSADVGNAVLSCMFFDPLFTPVELWRWLQFSANQIADPDISADTADPDGDGIPNLMEYAFALNPLLADTGSILQTGLVNDFIQMNFQRSKAATDLHFGIEISDDLLAWQPAEPFEREEIVGGNTVTVRCRFPIGPAHQFMRLQIRQAE